MARLASSRFLLSSLVASGLAAASWAQSTAPSASAQAAPATASVPAATSSPVFAPKPADTPSPGNGTAAPRRRAISAETSAALSAVAPKYTPPPPKVEPKPESEQIDMRDVDKPKNTIVRLPKYIVTEQKPPVFSERAISTEKGLTDIAMGRYISDMDRALNRFTLPLFGSSMQARALAMYAEDERLKNMDDLRANAIDAAKSDPAAGAYIMRQTRDTYLRTSDFGWNGGLNR